MKAELGCALSALFLSTALIASGCVFWKEPSSITGGDDELEDTGFVADTTTSGDEQTDEPGTDSSGSEGDTTTGTEDDTETETAQDTGSEVDSDTGPEQLSGDPCEDNPWPCHPVSNEGCSGQEACDWSELDGVLGFFCNEGSSAQLGEACNQLEGPWCVAGATCLAPADAEPGNWSDAFCVKYCCSSEDCEAGEECTAPEEYWQYVTGQTLGVCL